MLDILVQSRRNTKAGDRFFRKLLKQHGQPRVLVTDKLRSYGAALKPLAPGIDHRAHKELNMRNSDALIVGFNISHLNLPHSKYYDLVLA